MRSKNPTTSVPRALRLALGALACAALGCGDGAPKTSNAPAVPTDHNAPSSALVEQDPRPSPPWFASPRESWPRAVALHRADLRAFGRLDGGVGFLGVDRGGALVGITAGWFLTADAGLLDDAEPAYLEQLVKSWALVDVDGSGSEAVLGRRAYSGVGATGSDVVVLDARAAQGTELPCAPLVLSTRAPAVGEALWIGSAAADERWIAARLDRYARGAYLEFELPPGTDPDDVLGGPVLDARGFAIACVTSIDWSSEGDQPRPDEVLACGAQLLRPLLMSPPPLFGVPARFDAPGFDCIALDARGTMIFLGSPMLGGARVASWPEGATLASSNLPKGQGAGAFTPAGRLVMAGRGGAYAVFDVASGGLVAQGSVPSQLVTSVTVVDEARALLGSSVESGTFLVDVLGGGLLEKLDTWGAKVALSADRSQVAFGGGDGSIVLADLASGTTGTWLGVRRTLLAHQGEVTALAFSPDGSRLASGGQDGRIRMHDTASAALVWECADAPGDVNAVQFDGGQVVVATGSVEDVGGERRSVANYVRVFDVESGAERARSHDHPTPVIALLPIESATGGPLRFEGLTIGSDHFIWTLP